MYIVNTGNVAVSFGEDRQGRVMASLMTFFGLSGLVYSGLFEAVSRSTSPFLLILVLTSFLNIAGVLVYSSKPASDSQGTSTKEVTESLSPLQILKSPLFHLYCIASILQQGIVYMFNINTMLKVGDVNSSISLHVMILAISGAIGRFVFSMSADYFTSKTLLFAISQFFLLIPVMIMALIPDFSYFNGIVAITCSTFVGFGFGGAGFV